MTDLKEAGKAFAAANVKLQELKQVFGGEFTQSPNGKIADGLLALDHTLERAIDAMWKYTRYRDRQGGEQPESGTEERGKSRGHPYSRKRRSN